MNEPVEYRAQIQAVYTRIERAMEAVDPDLAECDAALGALTITFSDGARCILSAQPSVQQLWLALAREGIAYHFQLTALPPANDAPVRQWMDDKGRGIEILSFLQNYLRSALKIDLVL